MKLGFIGAGNMGSAMMRGIVHKGIFKAEDISASDPCRENLDKLRNECGICAAATNTEIAENAGIIVLAVKPQYYENVIQEIAPHIGEDSLIITIAPGKTLAWLRETFGKDVKIVRTMPNTPAMVGEGITGVCANELVNKKELEAALEILGGFGLAEVIPESLMNAVTAVSGSSPAFVFMMIESLADGAVAEGMPRAQAYRFAAQAVLGSARMVLDTGKHPGELKDMVCSPAGTTIEAVRVLEECGFRASIENAVIACADKAGSM